MKDKKLPVSKSDAEELTKRGAAGMAHATQGKANVIESKKLYDRNANKKEIESNGD
jgi:hypothetical protein